MRPEFGATSRDSEATKSQVMLEMITRIYAVIEFDPTGTILSANDNFLAALEYSMNEIVGEHHSMFVDKDYAQSAAYKTFWQDLAAGHAQQGQFGRVAKSGKTIWIQASYAPVFNDEGIVTSVIKVASDVTPRRTVVNDLAEGLNALKQGNLEYRVSAAADSELYELAAAYNASMDRLLELFEVVGQVATGLGQSAAEVSTRANQSAETALRNAASFEETSAEVEMVSQSITKTSENAAAALDRTNETAGIVDVGAETMTQALDATVEMRKSTTEMSGINEVIDSIAFQTNLLALNAGIEAARAGQSGAGFAVVATEIRSLAARSQDASSKIQALIARSVEQAKSTESFVHRGESNLKDVQTKSRLVAENMSQISNESREQANRVDVINKVVRDLAAASERASQSASENQDSAEALTTFSDKLEHELRAFGVGS